jgi:hypothetical protein
MQKICKTFNFSYLKDPVDPLLTTYIHMQAKSPKIVKNEAKTTITRSKLVQKQPNLNEHDRKKYALPGEGQWFPEQALMFGASKDVSSDSNKSAFFVGWDKDAEKGSKLYGLYPDSMTFYKQLSQNVAEQRFGYELIPENTSCKLYMDIEWEGQEQDKYHVKIRNIIDQLRKHSKTTFNNETTLEIYVCCGSRQKDDKIFKNSYHVVCPTIVFDRNHDGEMKNFMVGLCSGEDSNEWLYYSDANGKKKCYIDLSVYTKNRLIRLPGCCKKGSDVPLVRISGDAFDPEDKMVSQYDDINDPEYWRPFIISNPRMNEDVIICRNKYGTASNPERVSKRTRQNGKEEVEVCNKFAKKSESSESMHLESSAVPSPINPSQLEDALRQFGDHVSVVSKEQYKQDGQGTYWQVQCDQKKQTRLCLVDNKTEHKSNNCLLFLKKVGEGKLQLQLEYHCTSETCKHAPSKVLGVFSFDPVVYMWRFQKLSEHNGQAIHPEEDTSDCGSSTKTSTDIVMHSDQPEDNTYELVKERFEKVCFKVRTPFVYLRLEQRKDCSKAPELCYLKHHELQNFYCSLTYYEKNVISSKEQAQVQVTWQKKSFISDWLKDDKKKEVSTIIVDPKGTSADAYNLWSGYLAEAQVPSLTVGDHTFDSELEAIDFVLAPIFQHIVQVITDGNKEHAEWILDWIANIVQRPWQKTQVAIMLYGKQGCGKGILFDWLRICVLGPKHTFQTADPENDLFGKFSQGLVNVSLVQVDEVKNLHDHADKIKNAITNRTVKLEKKNKDPVTLDAFANIIFTSNNENALKIPGDDRRTVLFRCSSIYKGNKQYFDDLAHHLNLEGVSAWFYKIMKQRDLSKYPYDFQTSRPITDYYKESQNASIPLEKRYLSAYINGDTPLEITSEKMYKNFKIWAESENVKFNIKVHSAFGREIGRLSGIEIQKKKHHNIYKINKKMLTKFLAENKEYDEEAVLHDSCVDHLNAPRQFSYP